MKSKTNDSTKTEKLSISADILIFSVSDEIQSNYRKLNKKHFSVLLMKRDKSPFNIEDAAKRILTSEVNLHNIYLEQLYTFSNPHRDPRMRVVSTAYLALIDKNTLNEQIPANASWFNIMTIEDKESIYVTLNNDNEEIKFKIGKTLKEKTTDRYKYTILENDKIAFDHPLAIVSGISRLKNKLEYTDVVFNMMPEYFTLGELQQVYEVILGKKLLDPAFRRMIASKVEKTDKMQTGGGHRPSVLFKYKNND